MIKALAFIVYGLRFMVYGWGNCKLKTVNSKLLFLLIPYCLPAQTPAYKLIKTIPISAILLSSDKLGNCYVVNEKYELLKYSQSGELLYKFNNVSLGRITHIGTNNPLKILVYYPD